MCPGSPIDSIHCVSGAADQPGLKLLSVNHGPNQADSHGLSRVNEPINALRKDGQSAFTSETGDGGARRPLESALVGGESSTTKAIGTRISNQLCFHAHLHLSH